MFIIIIFYVLFKNVSIKGYHMVYGTKIERFTVY